MPFLAFNRAPHHTRVCIMSVWWCAVFTLSVVFAASAQEVPADMVSVKTSHFIIYYNPQVPLDYINKTSDAAERYYNNILDNLGFRRFNFWTWDNRARIFLYMTQDEYSAKTSRPKWSGASVDIKKKIISTYMGQKSFFETILPHELTHIIVREYIGFKARLPIWLEEGIACSQEQGTFGQRVASAKNLSHTTLFLPLKELNRIEREEAIAIPGLFYAEATSAIAFLLDEFGKERFGDFCKKLRNGNAWKDALYSVYQFRSFEDFESQWLAYLKK